MQMLADCFFFSLTGTAVMKYTTRCGLSTHLQKRSERLFNHRSLVRAESLKEVTGTKSMGKKETTRPRRTLKKDGQS